MAMAAIPALRTAFLGALLALAAAHDARAQSFAAPRTGVLALRATYGERGTEIPDDLVWRVYAVRGTDAQLVQETAAPRPSFVLQAGLYAVHVSHGLATATRQFNVGETGAVSTIAINAGALTVSGYLGVPERPIAPARQKLQVFIPTANNSEGKFVTDALRAGARLMLPEGTYHLVSTYSGSNSVVRSDVRIETGRVTEAIVNHRAATMTLKLVRERGGVALAGAEWTIETPGGDIVAEAAGAFPSVDVAEGTYNVLARHNDRDYRGQMKVEGGINRDFEIVVE
ncbi:hypothetical protein [Rhabdaerophilum calidifontis]|uniref:hypothetical protein n=1 Tax=Rhabdaerophilum calidifontis TaxID=2604328 RepID=UPI001239BD20|nr:hypothetical protein [Rhabdaerophilum calidifontis]